MKVYCLIWKFIPILIRRGEYYVTANGTVRVCGHGIIGESKNIFDKIDKHISLVFNLVSICAVFATLITYTLFKDLRNLPGLNLMCLATSIFTSRVNISFSILADLINSLIQVTFLLGERGSLSQSGCSLVAIIIHFTNLAIFFWTNVMAWDIYKTFGQRTVLSHIRPKEIHFPRYFAYGFGVPTVIVTFAAAINFSGFIPSFSVEYGKDGRCWIGNSLAIFVFFILPMIYVFITNTIFYLLTVSSINYVSSVTQSSRNGDRGRSDLFIYLRIFVILGITWVFGILFQFAKKGSDVQQVLVLCFVISDSLQGFFLFWIFTFNGRVFGLYTNLFKRMRDAELARKEEKQRLSLKNTKSKENYNRKKPTEGKHIMKRF